MCYLKHFQVRLFVIYPGPSNGGPWFYAVRQAFQSSCRRQAASGSHAQINLCHSTYQSTIFKLWSCYPAPLRLGPRIGSALNPPPPPRAVHRDHPILRRAPTHILTVSAMGVDEFLEYASPGKFVDSDSESTLARTHKSRSRCRDLTGRLPVVFYCKHSSWCCQCAP